jgi:exonuclease I
MPYIKQEDRALYEVEINALVAKLVKVFSEEPTKIVNNRAGHLNYIFTKIIKEFYSTLASRLGLGVLRYSDYNEIVGFLEACKLEFYRVFIAPYEEEKREENGKV